MHAMKDYIFSFDIFDTCICRSCGKPENIFYILADWLMPGACESNKMDFVRERKAAESKALSKVSQVHEVTIDDIYNNFDLSFFTHLPNDTVKEKEIEIELTSFYPIKRTMHLLDNCRKKGKVIFISDMYLPYSVLYKRLCELGVIYKGEKLYLSSNIGLTKRHGELYDYVKEKECIDLHHWIHYGDNLLADVYIPRRKHIKTIKVNTPSSNYESLIENESTFYNLHNVSVFSGLLRCHRLNNTLSNQDEFVSDMMAPFVISFAMSVLDQAQKDGIKRLFFASRDMYVVYLVAKEFSHLYPDIKLSYLNLSTRVLFPVCIKKGTKDELCEMMKMVYGFKPISFLKMLDYADKDIQEMSEEFDVDNLVDVRKNDLTPLIKLMLKDGRKNELVKRCAAKREIFLEYLKQEGFYNSGNEKVGLVDIGWRMSSQLVLNRIFSIEVAYYYYGMSIDRFSIIDTGNRHSFTCEENLPQLYQHREFIEYFICKTAEGMTIGYELSNSGRIVPVKEQTEISGKDSELFNSNIKQTVCIAKEWARMKLATPQTISILFACTQKIFDDFVRHPQSSLVGQIANHLAFAHYGKKSFLIKKLSWSDLVMFFCQQYIPFVRKRSFCGGERIWEKASFVYTFGGYGERLYQASHFPLKMRIRTGLATCYYKVRQFI